MHTTIRFSHFLMLCLLLVTAGTVGCGAKDAPSDDTQSESKDVSSPTTLRVWILGEDPAFAERMNRLWNAERRGDLEIEQIAPETYLAEHSGRPPADVLIYPQALIGDLVSRRAISELPEHVIESEQLDRRGLFDIDRRVAASWGDASVGLSLGTQQLVMLYREDLLQEWNLEPPSTWEEFRRVAEVIQSKRANSESEEWIPVALPLKGHWASDLMIARVASAIRDRSIYSDLFDFASMEPMIDRRPFVECLSEVTQLLKDDATRCLELTALDTTDFVLTGKSALAIGIIPAAEARPVDESAASPQRNNDVRIAGLPGSRRLYQFLDERWEERPADETAQATLVGVDGYNASVVTLSRRSAAAQKFLLWLVEPGNSSKVLPHSSHVAPFRNSHAQRIDVWVDPRLTEQARQDYAALVESSGENLLWLAIPRIPSSIQYRSALSDAVRQATTGEASPQVALTKAADLWREITKEKGQAAQLKAYEASLQLH